MKFMKLGSKPDIFQFYGDAISVASDLTSDVVLEVNGTKLLLHKFPLLSKSGRIHKLLAGARELNTEVIQLTDFPGGLDAFVLCAKFCYGISITLNALNVVAVRCAAEYLEMTENVEKGNLIFKLEVFLTSSVFRSWKDSIMALQSTKSVLPWSEDLKIVSRCIDSVASKTSVDPSKIDWSFTYTRGRLIKEPLVNNISSAETVASPPWNGIQSKRHAVVPKDWWIEDICELEINLYYRVIMAIKAKGRMSNELIGQALKFYSDRWLAGMSKEQAAADLVGGDGGNHSDENTETVAKNKLLLETIVSLLPSERGSLSCSFLLKLLKMVNILGAASLSKIELAKRIGLQLEDACLSDLLIPSTSYNNDSLYDVEIVQEIVEHFLSQDQSPSVSPSGLQKPLERRRTRSAENINVSDSKRWTSVTHSSKLKVAKLIDAYLAEIARDKNLSLSKLIALAETIPDFARPVHDGLYRAIDIYLKEHSELTKSERKRICRLMDCKKLSMDACMHAAQNERLPLRVIVQVLFFEQVRTAMTGGTETLLNDLPSNIKALLPPNDNSQKSMQSSTKDDSWDTVHHDFKALKGDLASMKQRIAEAEQERMQVQQEVVKHAKTKGMFNPKRFLGKIWSNKQLSESVKYSETSQSSDSPVSRNPSIGKLSASRNQRRSLS
ncbi:hypothetical protein O6H91_13G056700 [Diphasiastrum complanatum]|uniref:Uncharacterized protein n=1 Tax=Diphasiastrum complanatum TaxID=34168 RepID=A0ACC2BVM6_DIPCM|nr:hypothetical protein O6H91_13G056700 [Diphasiastrum complanatum]